MFRIASLATALLLAAAPVAAHDGVHVENAYALTSGPGAMSGAVFFEIVNHSTTSGDRLIAVASDVAERVELHTHLIDANGVARMIEVEDGLAVAPGETHMLQRGGDHVMLMGLTRPLADGDTFELRLRPPPGTGRAATALTAWAADPAPRRPRPARDASPAPGGPHGRGPPPRRARD